MSQSGTQDQVTLQAAMRAKKARALLARQDVSTFIEYVGRDEKTGIRLEQAPHHEEWQQLADAHDRLLIWAAVEHAKSNQLSIYRTLHQLGRDPSLRCVLVSNTATQAIKLARPIKAMIEAKSDALHEVFPDLVPGDVSGDQWTQTAMTVKRPTISKDPSIQVIGVHGAILGARVDLLILDDVLDFENTRTEAERTKLWDWYHSTFGGRLTDQGRIIVVGTAFHPEDFLHRMAKEPGWMARRFPAINAVGDPIWPQRWSRERLARKQSELPPIEWARQMLCIARDDATSRFKWDWIQQALKRGAGRNLAYGLEQLPPGCATYTGVDLAVSKSAQADSSVLFTIMVHPNGDREILWIDVGKWTGPEILQRIIDAHRRYQSIVIVENNASQEYIVQFTKAVSAVPVRPFTTGRNKAHPEFGVESLAAELAGGKWIFPNPGDGRAHPTIGKLIQGLLHYNPAAHVADEVMAMWFAREGSRMSSQKVQRGRLDLLTR